MHLHLTCFSYTYTYLKYISDAFSKETTAQSLLYTVVKIDSFLQGVRLQNVDDRGESFLPHHFRFGW